MSCSINKKGDSMKPSTYKRFKDTKKATTKMYYKMMYPLAWVIYKVEDQQNERFKEKVTLEYAAELLAKDIYKNMCKAGEYDQEDYVVIADSIHSESGYRKPYDIINSYAKFKSKSKKACSALSLGYIGKGRLNEFIELTMNTFAELNDYTYTYEHINEKIVKDSWDVKGYKKTIHFGIKEE